MKKYLYYYPNHTAFLSSTDLKNTHNVVYCDNEAHLHYDYHDYLQDYFTTVALESGTISFNIWKNMSTDMITSISYSTNNGETWTTTNNTNNKSEHLIITVNVNEGNKVLWKGNATQLGFYDNDEMVDDTAGSFFSSTCEFDAQGNVMSLLYGDNFKGETTIENDYTFAYLFFDHDEEKTCEIVDAKNLSLPATTLAYHCYYNMFESCTSLTTAPSILPAMTLAESCYESMFHGCTSLTTTPALPATTLAVSCYQWMFENCTSLTIAPELPATTLKNVCYASMFNGCTSLTTAYKLPATTLAESCYASMFRDCISLITAPLLPATTLTDACYMAMFNGCTSLTTAPELPATTLANHCYNQMFYGCTSLNSVTCLATDISAINCTYDWIEDVAASGTFTKHSSMNSWTIATNGIPANWIIRDYIPLDYIPEATLRIWIDTFPDDISYVEESRENAMRASLDLLIYKGANPYVYCGNTILYNGQTYYLWESQTTIDSQVQYFVTSSIDFNTLYELSLEDSLQNHFTSAIGTFNDLLTIYNPLNLVEQFLIKVERL